MILRAPRSRSGITLTEILISILIMGVGLVSLATLFPLGLLRLREATRNSRSTLLAETASSEMSSRNLLSLNSFNFSWYFTWRVNAVPTASGMPATPWSHDSTNPIASGQPFNVNTDVFNTIGPGLPVAYDPLWWSTTHQNDGITPWALEARFGAGVINDNGNWVQYVRSDPDGNPPGAYGLQRITNFMPWGVTQPNNVDDNLDGRVDDFTELSWPYTYPLAGQQLNGVYYTSPDVAGLIFASQDDVVFQRESRNVSRNQQISDPTTDPNSPNNTGMGSPLVPQLIYDPNSQTLSPPMNDWSYSWMFTGFQADVNDAKVFSGDVVISNNRPFGATPTPSTFGGTARVPNGERVVEAIYGYGFSNRVVLFLWPAGLPDPDVKVGSWFADTTYERNSQTGANRYGGTGIPARRCYWYQVAKRTDAEIGPNFNGVAYRQMTVTLSAPVRAITPQTLQGNFWMPNHVNVAVLCPSVVNVFPKTFYVR